MSENRDAECIVTIDMERMARSIGLTRGWSTYKNADIEACLEEVKKKVGDSTTEVHIVGPMPTLVGMVLTAALYPKIRKLEYGSYRGPRDTVFHADDEQCPEMRV